MASATYSADNQQLTFGSQTLTYDLNGNLTSDGTNTYTWTARDQLATISGPVLASFVYDGVGRRMHKTLNGTMTEFLYDGVNPIQEVSGAATTSVLTGLGIDEYFVRADAIEMSAFLTDVLGSTVALTDPAGAVQTQYTYEPFGATTALGAASSNPFGYTGREKDGTGLYYYRARYYHPGLQRFISEDPIAFAGGDFNVYAYVRNRPTRFIDPKGLQQLELTDPIFGPSNPNECIPRCTTFGDPINDPAMAAAVNRIFFDKFLELILSRFGSRLGNIDKAFPPGCCSIPTPFGPSPAGAAPPEPTPPSPAQPSSPPSKSSG